MTAAAGEGGDAGVVFLLTLPFVRPSGPVFDAFTMTISALKTFGDVDISIVLPARASAGVGLQRRMAEVAAAGGWIADDIEEDFVFGVEAGLVVGDFQRGDFVGLVLVNFQVASLAAGFGQAKHDGRNPFEVLIVDELGALGRVVKVVGGVTDEAIDFKLSRKEPAVFWIGFGRRRRFGGLGGGLS